MPKTVFLDYTQEELDRAYDQRVWAPSADTVLSEWAAAARATRESIPGYVEQAYSPSPRQKLDIYPSPLNGAPIHIHIHGGAWRARSKDDGAILAPAATASGMHLVVPDFDLLPTVRMTQMVEQVAAAVAWVHENAASFGGDRDRIVLSGHSSGAHLAAAVATLDWRGRGLPECPLRALVCASGAYDLEPVLLSHRRSYVELTPEEADRLSAPRHAERIRCPVWVLWGACESPEFIRQGKAFAAVLDAVGRLAGAIEMPGLGHFDVCQALGTPGSPAHRAVLEALSASNARNDPPAGPISSPPGSLRAS